MKANAEIVRDLRRVLNSVENRNFEERHHIMITELRIRKILAREKLKYPSKEELRQRFTDMYDLYKTLDRATNKVD